MAYDWAFEKALPQTRERFQRKGVKMVMGSDIQRGSGPTWAFNRLEFERVGDQLKVSSSAQKTQQTYWKDTFGPIPRPPFIPDPGCFHYCKLLSPARALEWML